MSTRKIKDAKDLNDGSLIYFKGHAKATYMSDGRTVEDAINNIKVGIGIDLFNYATKEELNSKQDIISDLETIRQGSEKGATSVQQGTLSTVATSGSYNDLTNKPTIPNAVIESTVSGWGFTKNTGTVTGVKVNGATKNPSNGVVDIGNVITSHQDISGKQDKLVSGTNIKTINGTSILGSGNIVISGGNSSSSGSVAYPLVRHGTSETTFTLTPNTFHIWDTVATLDLDFGTETEGVANEYLFQFTSGSTATTLTLPSFIIWANNETPIIEGNSVYQVSILNNYSTLMRFSNKPFLYP